MHRFWDVIIGPVLRDLAPRTIVEIGSQSGAGTKHILELCAELGAHVHIIDPLQIGNAEEIEALLAKHGTFHQAKSHDALERMAPADAYLIDGDHNWYTVHGELERIWAAVERNQAAPPLLMFHDVEWPYGRRDLYYAPDDIPKSARHPNAKKGLAPGNEGLVDEGGINPHLFHAQREGGPKNGVLTAIEDFLAAHPDRWRLFVQPGMNGLAMMVPLSRLDEPFARRIVALCELSDVHRAYVERMEADRIRLHREFCEVARSRAEEREKASENRQKIARLEGQVRSLQKQLENIKAVPGYRALAAVLKAARRIKKD